MWKTQEEGPQRNISEIFVLDTLKTTFWMTNLRWTNNQGLFFQNQDTFLISKRAGEVSPLFSSCASVSVAEYASIPLVMATQSWKCLNKLFNKLLRMPWILNKPEFWIWHDCICKNYAESRIRLIMVLFTSVCLSVPQDDWTWRNIAECPWIYLDRSE